MPLSPEDQAIFDKEVDRRGLRDEYEHMKSVRYWKQIGQRALEDVHTVGSAIGGLLFDRPWEASVKFAVDGVTNKAIAKVVPETESKKGLLETGAEFVVGSAPVQITKAYLGAPFGLKGGAAVHAAKKAFEEHPVIAPLETLLTGTLVKGGLKAALAASERRELLSAAAKQGFRDALKEQSGVRLAEKTAETSRIRQIVAERKGAQAAEAAEVALRGPKQQATLARAAEAETVGRIRTTFRPQAEAVANALNQHIGDAARAKVSLTPTELKRLAEQVRLEMQNRKMFPAAPETGMPLPPDQPFPRSMVEQMFKSIPERVFTGDKPVTAFTADDVLSAFMGNERTKVAISKVGVSILEARAKPSTLLELPAPTDAYGPGFVMTPGELRVPRMVPSKAKVSAGGVRDLSKVVKAPSVTKGAIEIRPQSPPVIANAAPSATRPGTLGNKILPNAEPITAEVVVPAAGPAVFRSGFVGHTFKRVKNQAQSVWSKILVNDIGKVSDYHHGLAGKQLEVLRDTKMHNLLAPQRVELRQAMKGKVTPTDPNVSGSLDDAKTLLDSYADEFEARGMMVEMPDGTLRPWKRATDYAPDILKPEVARALWDGSRKAVAEATKAVSRETSGAIDRASVEGTLNRMYQSGQLAKNAYLQRAITALMEKNVAKSAAEAIQYLSRRGHQDMFRLFGNVDMAKVSHLPDDFFEQDGVKVLTEYIYGASRRLAEAKVWGPRGERLVETIGKIAKENPAEGEYFQQVADVFVGNKDRAFASANPGLKQIYDAYTDFSVAMKIGLGTAIIPNMTQLAISAIPALGYQAVAKGVLGSLFDPALRSSLREAGVVVSESMRNFMQVEHGGVGGRISSKILVPFVGVNKGLKYMAAASMDAAWDDVIRAAGDPLSSSHASSLRTLKRLGLSVKEASTATGRERAIFRFASNSQLQRNILEEPLILNNPYMRPFLLFKRFGYRQATFIKDWVWDELKAGNVAPFLRLASAGYLGGEFVIWAKDNLKELISGKEVFRPDQPFWARAARAYAEVGGIGTFGDLARVTSGLPLDVAEKIYNNGVFAITPLPLSDAYRVGKVATNAFKEIRARGIVAGGRRAGIEAVKQAGGSLIAAAADRLKSDADLESEAMARRNRTQTEINSLYSRLDFDRAINLFVQWNEQFPTTPVRLPDADELLELYKNDQMRKMDIPQSVQQAAP